MNKIRLRPLFGKLTAASFLWILLVFHNQTLRAQDKTEKQKTDSVMEHIYQNKGDRMAGIIIDGDTVPIWIMDEILFVDKPSFDSDEARRRYYLLKRKVIHVYPYAYMAGDKLDSLNFRLSLLKRNRDKKRFINEFQFYLEFQFEEELKQLTRSEGQILCKLIHRETGRTAFDLVKEYRSGTRAFFYNLTANYYEFSLKKEYDPENDQEDKFIENILQKAFAEGQLKERQQRVFNPEDFDDIGEVKKLTRKEKRTMRKQMREKRKEMKQKKK